MLERSFAELNPMTDLLWNWHIDVILDRLEACCRGDNRRLIINVPPRSLKLLSASVPFPVFLFGHNPSAQIICASYGQELAGKLARDTQTIMQSAWYRAGFGQRLVAARPSAQEIITREPGFCLSALVGGVLAGRGADFLVIDDPVKLEEAVSDVQHTRANEWHDRTPSVASTTSNADALSSSCNGCTRPTSSDISSNATCGCIYPSQRSPSAARPSTIRAYWADKRPNSALATS